MSVAPLLRWAGSKKSVMPKLVNYFPKSFGRYIEPFAGSACLFFFTEPMAAVINDNNPTLMSFYNDVRDNPLQIFSNMTSLIRDPTSYYEIRRQFNSELPGLYKSTLFFYLNRNCFNGIYRTNIKGEFNVPFASWRVALYPTKEDLISASALLQRARLCNVDFASLCLSAAEAGDFIYLDPPYYVPQIRTFREYSSNPFSLPDFKRLEALLKLLNRRGVAFMVSYPDCDISRELASIWQVEKIDVRRRVSGAAASRSISSELIIRNYN